MMLSNKRVGVIGVGNVGIASAFAMYTSKVANEIILVDKDKEKAEGEALDMMNGQGLIGSNYVKHGNIEDLSSCQVIVITAGIGQKSNTETRLMLLEKNAKLIIDLAKDLDKYAPEAILIVTSNPVDILTHILQKSSKRSSRKIIGTGTMLDTSRLHTFLGQHYNVNPLSIHGYILGEHGDSEIVAWSSVNIAGNAVINNRILDVPYDEEALNAIAYKVKCAAYDIINLKGHTSSAIGIVVSCL